LHPVLAHFLHDIRQWDAQVARKATVVALPVPAREFHNINHALDSWSVPNQTVYNSWPGKPEFPEF